MSTHEQQDEIARAVAAAWAATRNRDASWRAGWAVVAPLPRYCDGQCDRCDDDAAAVEAAIRAQCSDALTEDPMPARKPKPPARGGARPGAGRPRTRPEGARKVQVVLSPAAAEAWAAYEGDRSRWVSGLIEAAVPSSGVYAEALAHAASLVQATPFAGYTDRPLREADDETGDEWELLNAARLRVVEMLARLAGVEIGRAHV